MKYILLFGLILLMSCHSTQQKTNTFTGANKEIKLITLAPGHFHAALIQKRSLNQIDDKVYVYAPEGKELEAHLAYIESYNSQQTNPTHWEEIIYTGDDFLEKMISNKKGNVVVLAGNNKLKTDYIYQSIDAGLNVLADKPMAIDYPSFQKLEKAYRIAEEKDVLLYDLMTERYVDYNIVNRLLMQDQSLFGELQSGTIDNPAIELKSVHHFYKEVSGKPLIRPVWYYDVNQQGEGLVDVTTHLIDLVLWKSFPDQAIDHTKDVEVINAKHWPTFISKEEFEKSTRWSYFPDYLPVENDTLIAVYANGDINYTVNDKHVSLSVAWNFQAPANTGDIHTSIFKGTKSTLSILQGEEQNYIPKLYIEKGDPFTEEEFMSHLTKAIENLKPEYNIEIKPTAEGRKELVIHSKEKTSHEDHFSLVADKFFGYLVNRDIPEWETKNTLTKYYITTKALEIARSKD